MVLSCKDAPLSSAVVLFEVAHVLQNVARVSPESVMTSLPAPWAQFSAEVPGKQRSPKRQARGPKRNARWGLGATAMDRTSTPPPPPPYPPPKH